MMPDIERFLPGPAGNVYPKYETRNPVARFLVAGYLRAFRELVHRTGASTALEVGCGEGYLANILAENGISVRATDASPEIICEAKRLWPSHIPIRFECRRVEDLDPDVDSAPLVICCEVLEHLADPERAVERLAMLARPHLIVSVPREPLWRALNLARCRYVADLGNTPGHLQHWSRSGFLSMLHRHVEITEVRSPLPWTLALCRPAGRPE